MDKKQKNKNSTNYAYYTGIGFQMLMTIIVFTFIGYKIDQAKGRPPGIVTGIFSLIGVCASIYTVIRSLMKHNK